MVWAEHTELFFKSQELFFEFSVNRFAQFWAEEFSPYRDSVRGSLRELQGHLNVPPRFKAGIPLIKARAFVINARLRWN